MTTYFDNPETIMMISHVTAKIALFAFLLIILKFASKKTAKTNIQLFKKTDKIFMKIHKPVGFAMIGFALIHGIFSVYSIELIGAGPFIIGAVSFAACLIAVVSFYQRKKMEKTSRWLRVHQLSTVIAMITLIWHIVMAKNAVFPV